MGNTHQQCIFCGNRSIEHLNDFLTDFCCRKILLVAGKSYDSLPIKSAIDAIGPDNIRFSDFNPNPSYEDICKGVELFKRERCDAIVAIGGGSAMDTAKCIKLFCRMSENIPFLKQEYFDTKVPLAAIPTTAGTGSEATRYAVIYWQGEKQSVTHDSIIPDCVFLVPEVLHSLPLYQKKCTLLDALCQGIEAWWSINSTDASKALSREVVSGIMQNYRAYLAGDEKAAEQIMLASCKSGQAINITQTTAAHAMSYKLTSLYGLPHGRAVAVCMPSLWDYMLQNMENCADLRGCKYLQQTFKDISETFYPENPLCATDRFRSLLAELEIDCSVKTHPGDLELLVSSVNPVRLKNNPVSLPENVLRNLYTDILTNVK